jgi:hypothetical protein
MVTLSIVSMRSVSEAQAGDRSFKSIALFCCLGLVASLGLMTFGIDFSASWV